MNDNIIVKNKKTIFLCSICNIESGVCEEDCKFCAQSNRYKADIDKYRQKEISLIVQEAKQAKKNKAVGFCLVSSSRGLNDKRIKFILECIKAIRVSGNDINLICSNGLASVEQLKILKDGGISKYNHNLESSREFYPNICTSHSWDERLQTNLNAKKAGLKLCVGGIFGLGESKKDRISMLEEIAKLEPYCVPLNFFHPNKALPIVKNQINIEEAFKIIKIARDIIGKKPRLMIAGGRELMFKNREYEVFKYGANALVVGDYLTTIGKNGANEVKELEELGYYISPKG
jgi:biotin synthase